jgi:hypothetical protein
MKLPQGMISYNLTSQRARKDLSLLLVYFGTKPIAVLFDDALADQ